MSALSAIERALGGVALDVVRLSVWLVFLMAVFVPLERWFAAVPRKAPRAGLRVDVIYYFLNSLLPKALLALPMAVIASALRGVVPHAVHAWMANLPLGARLGAALVVGEFGFYWGHRWVHEVPWLWRFHTIHHSPESVDWLVNTRAHPLDIVFVRLCGFVPMYALGLAQPVTQAQLDVVPLLVMLVATLWGFFIHANIRWRFGWLERLISTPNFHHWHHTNDEHVNRNYASMLPCMDALFGTLHAPGKQWPPSYGVNTRVPDDLGEQVLYPFRKSASVPDQGAGSPSIGS